MHFLEREHETLRRFLPKLSEELTKAPLSTFENRDSALIPLFRDSAGPGLVIPNEYGGSGATPLEAVRVQRAIGSRSPSLAVASTMHHFSVATLVELSVRKSGLEWMILEAIAKQQLLVASGFAEGQSGQGVLHTTMQATRGPDGFIVNGSKKPCSLSRSMDFLTASLSIRETDSSLGQFGVALIPAGSSGMERREFWNSWVLTGAESDEIVLRDVLVPPDLVYIPEDPSGLDEVGLAGFLWFELLISASYLGMASALVEDVVSTGKGDSTLRATLGTELEAAMAALEGIARSMMADGVDTDLLASSLFVRYSVQGAIERASALATEILGGMAYITSPVNSYLFASVRALAFHPPSRRSGNAALDAYMSGRLFKIE